MAAEPAGAPPCSGRELFADLLEVGDGALEFELRGVCAYESTFEYSSAD